MSHNRFAPILRIFRRAMSHNKFCLHSEKWTQEAREAFDDMVELCLSKRKCVSVEGNYT